MTRTLRRHLRVSFGLLLVIVAVVGAAGVVATTTTAADVEQVTRTVAPALETNGEVLQDLTDMETGLRGYVLSARAETLRPYRSGLRRLPRHLSELDDLLRDDPQGQRIYAEQDRAIETWLREYAVPRVRDPVGPGSFDPERFQRARRLFQRIRDDNGALRDHLRQRLEELRADAGRVRDLMVLGVLVLTLAGLLVGALTSRSASRRVRRPLAAMRDVLTALISGEHDARAVPAGPHEVATIARSVNALADETDRLRVLEADERRLQERLLRFGRMVRESLDPDEVVRLGLTELGESLRLGRAYARLVEDGELRGISSQWCAPGASELADLASPGSMGVLRALHRRRRPMTSEDVLTDPFFDTPQGRRWLEGTGARASMTVPIAVEDNPVGVITCIDFEARPWHDSEVHLAETVAADVGRALEHARLYTAQVSAVQRLEELDRAKDDFLSSVSHELRTPLTSINGYVELLEDEDAGPVTGQQRRLLDVVRRNVDRLRLLIEDLLTLSRIESGAFRSTLQQVDLSTLVSAAVEDMRPQAQEGRVDVRVHAPEGAVHVHGDAGQLSRALLNVVSNAVKFTPDGGQVDVHLDLDAVSGTAAIEVRDSGMGIPATDLDSMFTRFFRASNAVSSGVPGTGLGLVIVRTILDNHGGSLDLSSCLGHGTAVTMTIPVATAATGDQP